MKNSIKLGVIGAGFMSSAIIKGVIDAKILNPNDIIVSDLSDDALNKMSSLGVLTTKDNNDVVEKAKFTLFAVKPQSLSSVFESITSNCDKIISIMAGVKKDRFKQKFPSSLIARCMPNTPCSIGFGAVGVDLSDFVDKIDVDFILSLLSSFSKVVCVSEDKLNAVTGVSGSAPAYFYIFIKGIIDAGVKHGLTFNEAKDLATATMIGAGKMIESNSDKSLDDLINAVCSKGGTTIQAINVYNEEGLNKITENAIDACVKRAFELENI